jgi:hypothetical protein
LIRILVFIPPGLNLRLLSVKASGKIPVQIISTDHRFDGEKNNNMPVVLTLKIIIIIFQVLRTVDLIKPSSKSKAHRCVLNCFTIFSILTTALTGMSVVFTGVVDASKFESSAR